MISVRAVWLFENHLWIIVLFAKQLLLKCFKYYCFIDRDSSNCCQCFRGDVTNVSLWHIFLLRHFCLSFFRVTSPFLSSTTNLPVFLLRQLYLSVFCVTSVFLSDATQQTIWTRAVNFANMCQKRFRMRFHNLRMWQLYTHMSYSSSSFLQEFCLYIYIYIVYIVTWGTWWRRILVYSVLHHTIAIITQRIHRITLSTEQVQCLTCGTSIVSHRQNNVCLTDRINCVSQVDWVKYLTSALSLLHHTLSQTKWV